MLTQALLEYSQSFGSEQFLTAQAKFQALMAIADTHQRQQAWAEECSIYDGLLSIHDQLLKVLPLHAVGSETEALRLIADQQIKFIAKCNLDILYRRGITHKHLGNYLKAQSDFEALLAVNGKNIDALFDLGIICSRQLNHKKSAEFFARCFELEPSEGWALFNLASAELLEKHNQEALDHFNKFISQFRQVSVDAFFWRARAQQSLGEHAKAVVDFDVYISKKPRDPDAIFYRALSYAVLGQNCEALKGFEALESVVESCCDKFLFTQKEFYQHYAEALKVKSSLTPVAIFADTAPLAHSVSNMASSSPARKGRKRKISDDGAHQNQERGRDDAVPRLVRCKQLFFNIPVAVDPELKSPGINP